MKETTQTQVSKIINMPVTDAVSLICGIIFYSVGFRLYGQLSRTEVYLSLLDIWTFQIIFSHIWLHFFRFGPFEWLWRSLTYWKRQPMVR